jgi:hypothetical protein
LREDIRKMKTEMEYNIKETATRVRVWIGEVSTAEYLACTGR